MAFIEVKDLTFAYSEEYGQVIKGIDLTIEKGSYTAVLGHNGCGKSTTLKMLTKIMYPDAGTIEMNGRVSSLIELGAGFHPDMSGRENIYINASIFGLGKKEIEAKIGELKEELCKPEYASSYSKLSEIQGEIDATEAELIEGMERWEEEHEG